MKERKDINSLGVSKLLADRLNRLINVDLKVCWDPDGSQQFGTHQEHLYLFLSF